MFEKSQNLQATVHALSFRTKDSRQADATKICEVTFEAELDRALAKDVVAEMAEDLFTERGKPKADMTEAAYAAKSATYLLAVRLTPAGRQQKLSGVTVRRVVAYKVAGAEGWRLGFTASFILLTPEEAFPFLKHLRQSVYLTFEEQEPTMELEGGEGEGEGTDFDVDDKGGVSRVRKGQRAH